MGEGTRNQKLCRLRSSDRLTFEVSGLKLRKEGYYILLWILPLKNIKRQTLNFKLFPQILQILFSLIMDRIIDKHRPLTDSCCSFYS